MYQNGNVRNYLLNMGNYFCSWWLLMKLFLFLYGVH